MQKKTKKETDPDRDLYLRQNSAIHKARAQLGMEVDDVRAIAKELWGVASLSVLPPLERWELIGELKLQGANVYNPPIPKAHVKAENVYYQIRLEYWDNKFPRNRPGFASNKQLAWIQALWELDFDDGRCDSDKGLRGFIFRQTRRLKDGPVSDLTFLKSHHVRAVLTPLKARAKENLKDRKRREE